LESQGLKLVSTQALVAGSGGKALGELDLIMREGETWVFVEVRSRESMRFGGAAASITPTKQKRIKHAALGFLQAHLKLRSLNQMPPCRFDVVAIEGQELQWIPNAF
jgi:putative endonuclease